MARISRLLFTDVEKISWSNGGKVNYSLFAGNKNADRKFYLLGGISGTEPGTSLPGGKMILPLNWDAFTYSAMNLGNTPVFSNFMGSLDSPGRAKAKLDILGPLPPGSLGLAMHFAYALNKPWNLVSNPVGIEIVQ